MPKYEYCCTKCANIFEIDKKVSEHTNEEKCPKCEEIAKQVFTPPAITFHGPGFYKTSSRLSE